MRVKDALKLDLTEETKDWLREQNPNHFVALMENKIVTVPDTIHNRRILEPTLKDLKDQWEPSTFFPHTSKRKSE